MDVRAWLPSAATFPIDKPRNLGGRLHAGLMRLDLSADAANSPFVGRLSNPAYAWNDHTGLMFPYGFIKLP
jgi:hypothetical protein